MIDWRPIDTAPDGRTVLVWDDYYQAVMAVLANGHWHDRTIGEDDRRYLDPDAWAEINVPRPA